MKAQKVPYSTSIEMTGKVYITSCNLVIKSNRRVGSEECEECGYFHFKNGKENYILCRNKKLNELF
jgi:hypothetical protein